MKKVEEKEEAIQHETVTKKLTLVLITFWDLKLFHTQTHMWYATRIILHFPHCYGKYASSGSGKKKVM